MSLNKYSVQVYTVVGILLIIGIIVGVMAVSLGSNDHIVSIVKAVDEEMVCFELTTTQ